MITYHTLGKVHNAAQKVSRVALALLGTLTAAAVAFINVGDELDDAAKKYSISAEQLQIQRNLYAKATDDAKNYDKALSSLNSIMASIAKGRGTAYIETLNRLGVATVDASGKTRGAAEVYSDIVSALSRLSDETERATCPAYCLAITVSMWQMLPRLQRKKLAAYNTELAKSGIISSRAAEQAGLISDQAGQLQTTDFRGISRIGSRTAPCNTRFN